MTEILNRDLSQINRACGLHHGHLFNWIRTKAGGLARLGIHTAKLVYVRHLWFTERRADAMMRFTALFHFQDVVSHFEGGDSMLQETCVSNFGSAELIPVDSISS